MILFWALLILAFSYGQSRADTKYYNVPFHVFHNKLEANKLTNFIYQNSGKNDIYLIMDYNPGGKVFLLKPILRAIDNFKGTVTVFCRKSCGSAGADLWAWGDIRLVNSDTRLMFHAIQKCWEENGKIKYCKADTSDPDNKWFTKQYIKRGIKKLMKPYQWRAYLQGNDVVILGSQVIQRG